MTQPHTHTHTQQEQKNRERNSSYSKDGSDSNSRNRHKRWPLINEINGQAAALKRHLHHHQHKHITTEHPIQWAIICQQNFAVDRLLRSSRKLNAQHPTTTAAMLEKRKKEWQRGRTKTAAAGAALWQRLTSILSSEKGAEWAGKEGKRRENETENTERPLFGCLLKREGEVPSTHKSPQWICVQGSVSSSRQAGRQNKTKTTITTSPTVCNTPLSTSYLGTSIAGCLLLSCLLPSSIGSWDKLHNKTRLLHDWTESKGKEKQSKAKQSKGAGPDKKKGKRKRAKSEREVIEAKA